MEELYSTAILIEAYFQSCYAVTIKTVIDYFYSLIESEMLILILRFYVSRDKVDNTAWWTLVIRWVSYGAYIKGAIAPLFRWLHRIRQD